MTCLKLSLAVFLLGAGASLPAAEAPLYTDTNMPPAVMQMLLHSQDLALNLKYKESLAELEEARKLQPTHSLVKVFFLATRLSILQESIRQGHPEATEELFKDIAGLMAQSEAQARAYPKSAYPKFYLGASYGCRGLAKLYTGHYLDSYFDGKKGVALVREAVAIEPQLYNAYMGLGQFEYYCGSLGTVLRFFLSLHGSEEKGLEMLQTCGEKATYAAWPCRLYRVKLMVSERKDYVDSAPDLAVVMQRYPDNYDLARQVFVCLENGSSDPGLIKIGDGMLARLKQGWKVPDYARLDVNYCQKVMDKVKRAPSKEAP